jgi:hypothetical protein
MIQRRQRYRITVRSPPLLATLASYLDFFAGAYDAPRSVSGSLQRPP